MWRSHYIQRLNVVSGEEANAGLWELTLNLRALHLSHAFEGFPRNTMMSPWVHGFVAMWKLTMVEVLVR